MGHTALTENAAIRYTNSNCGVSLSSIQQANNITVQDPPPPSPHQGGMLAMDRIHTDQSPHHLLC